MQGEAASIATPFQGRSETLLTLRAFGVSPAALATSVAQDPQGSTEYTARKVIALAAAGRDFSIAYNALLSLQNADGGFGGNAGYTSHALDTSFALLALKSAAAADGSAATAALGFLSGVQSVDGSFGVNGQPSIYVTAIALQALNAFASSSALSTRISAARGWLVRQQSATAYATTLENAHAAIAIAGTSTDSTLFAAVQAALKAAQLADGSWNGDPYLTAIAIRALAATASVPPPGTTGQIAGTVLDQSTGAPLQGVQVQVAGPQAATTTSDASGSFNLPTLISGSYTLQLSKAGYTTITQTVPVTANVVSNVGTLRMQAATTTASLQGVVRDGGTGQVLAGAAVSVSGGPTATTGAGGDYQLAGLIPGAVTITVAKAGYETLSLSATLTAGVITSFFPSLYLTGQAPATTSLAGRVVDVSSAAAVAGATIQVGASTTTSNATGDFTLSNLTAGSVTVQVSAPGYVTGNFSATLAPGLNNAGNIAIAKQPASARLSGRVAQNITSLPIGGAIVRVNGTTLSAATNSNGTYTIDGITQTSFTLTVSAPGYVSRNVAVTLPALADSSVEVLLDKVPPNGIAINRVTTDKPSYEPFSVIDLDVSVQNSGAQPAAAIFTATVMDALGNTVMEVPGIARTIPAGAAPVEIDVETHLANPPAGTYSAVVRAFDASGAMVTEGSASFVVISVMKLGGGITLDPPITQYGTNQAVALSANLSNMGNLPIGAGNLELTVTLLNADSDPPAAHLEAGTTLVSGGLLNGPIGGGFDAQGNFFTVNQNDARVVKITPQGVTSVVMTLPFSVTNPFVTFQPRDSIADADGNLYILQFAPEIWKVTPTGTLTRIRTNLNFQATFDRDASGTFFIVTNDSAAGPRVIRQAPDGSQTLWNAQGVGNPWGVVRTTDGNLYVTDSTSGSVARVTPRGVVTNVVTDPSTLRTPRGIVAGPDGNFYIANNGGDNIVRMTPSGALSPYATGLSKPTDLSFDSQGQLFVTNSGNNTVSVVPKGGGVAQLFARTLVSSPQGMAYDGANNLYVAGSSQLVKLDASDNVTVVSTSMSAPQQVAVNAAGEIYVANQGPGSITKTVVTNGTPSTTTFATGLTSAYGVAVGPGGVLYASDKSSTVNRIYSIGTDGSKTIAAESLMTDPKDIWVAPSGDRYVLNGTYIAKLPASGPVSLVMRGGISVAQAFFPSPDGGFFVQESLAVKRISSTGVVTTVKSGFNSLANGIVADASGNVLIGEQNGTSSRIARIDTAGTVTTFAALPEAPTVIIDDLAGGVYMGAGVGNVYRVTSQGVVSKLNSSSASNGFLTRLALDTANNRLFVSDGQSIRTFDLASHVSGPATFIGAHTAIEVTGGALLMLDSSGLELKSISPQGQVTSLATGFSEPGPITSDGTALYFADRGRVLSLLPGGVPHTVAASTVGTTVTAAAHLAWRNGVLYMTGIGTVQQLRLGVDTSFTPYYVLTTGSFQGLAFRGDGFLSLSSTDNRVLTLDVNKQVVASYAGINGPAGIAVDNAGNVFVASQTGNQVVRIPAAGKQSSVFASNVSAGPLAFDATGALHAVLSLSNGMRLVRFDATGAQTMIAATAASGSPHGLSISPAGTFVSDGITAGLYMVRGIEMIGFADGIVSPKVARLDASGNLFIAGSSSVSKFNNGTMVTLAPGVSMPNVSGLAFAPDGKLLVASQASNGFFWSIDAASGESHELGSMLNLFGRAGSIFTIARSPVTGSFYVPNVNTTWRVDRITYVAPALPPQVGSVVLTRTAGFGGLATDSLPTPVGFGSWVPPFGGDFRLAVRVVGGAVPGEAVNVLHVGPSATGQIVPARATLPPGDQQLGIAVNVTGADFTSVSKADPANITAVVPTGALALSMGPDAAGNVYVASNNSPVKRYSPSGAVTDVFTPTVGIAMRGIVPVDDAQNFYVSDGVGNKEVKRITPKGNNLPDGTVAITTTATTIAFLPEHIVSLARISGDVIYAVTDTSIYRIAPGDDPHAPKKFDVPALQFPFSATADGQDNLYVLFGNATNLINKYAPDKTVTTVLRPGAWSQPNFEYEGMNIAGDCADNLFVTPYRWDLIGQDGAEEYTIAQLTGRTGKVAQILNGRTLNPQLVDLDFIVYDRFERSLLMYTDNFGGSVFRIPVTCGAVSTDIHLVFPAGRDAGGFSLAPSARMARADGSTEYVWSLKDVSSLGKSLSLATTLRGLKLGDVVPVASEAFLAFKNTFVPGDIKVPLTIPTVGVDGMVDIAVLLDKPQYEANTDVLSTVRLANRDKTPKVGLLIVEVTDSQGVRLATAAQQLVTIPAADTYEVKPPFNTGSFLTGPYRMKATLNDPTGAIVATAATQFDIVAGQATLVSSVTTDKQQYGPFDPVTVTSRVRNLSLNAIASDLSTQVSVKDPSGQVLLSATARIATLLPQALKDSAFSVQLNAAAPGIYTVEERLVDSTGRMLEAAPRTATFTVLSSADSGSGLRGVVTATKLANVGEPITVTVVVTNQGNAAADVPLTIRIVNPASGQVVQFWTATVSLAQGAQQQSVRVWTTAGAAAGLYIASAVATFNGREIPLGQDTFTLVANDDKSPEAFRFDAQIDVPLGVRRTSNTVAITGINTTVPISVTGGEYSVNGGPFTAVPGTVKNNDTVAVRQISASSFATKTTATLTVSDFAAPFDVTTKATADLTMLPSIPADGRVLVLLSCKAGFVEAADDDPACLAQRQSFLDAYLTQLGVSHRIVTTTEDFRTEFRSGKYNVYWISGGALKLKDTLAPELLEAAFRGENVIVDGVHDQRNSTFDAMLGISYKGKPNGLATVTIAGGIFPAGTFKVAGAAPIRVELLGGAIRQAQFETGDPAISTAAFGYGKSLLFAFDLTGTLQAQAASTLLRDTVDASIDWVTPPVPASFTGGAYVPLTLTFRNSEAVPVTLDVTAALPAGFALAAGAPPATLSGSTVEWQLAIPAAASKSVDWAIRTPDASGSYSIPLVVKQVYGGTSVQLGTPSIAIEVRAVIATLPAVITQVQALAPAAPNERNARDAAVKALFAAQASISSARWDEAIGNLVTALDKLDAVTSVPIAAQRVAIDTVMKEVERRWWSTLPACPATPNCR